jgi:hypothetical protein
MADEGIVDNYAQSGWAELRQMFIDNNLSELANIITDSIQNNGVNNSNLVYEDLRKSEPYKIRFAGNFARLANGKNFLSERAYLEQENMYAEVMTPYGAGALATRDNYAKFIANDVSVSELSDRFTLAYDRVTKAVNAEDKALVDELKKMYPGVTDNELATSLLLGKEGSKYLNTKINIAEIKAAETESGVQSVLGSDFLETQKLNRTQARIGLSKVAEQKTGIEQASRMFGETSTEGLQKELEQENLLGQTSKRTKRLASQARAEFGGTSGIKTGSLGRKTQV